MDEEPRAPRSTDDDADELIARRGREGGGTQRGQMDGPISDEVADPAFAPVVEAGGGVSEGFEQSEAALVEHATDADPRGTEHIDADSGEPEEPEQAAYGEADEERSGSRRDPEDPAE